MNDKTISPSDTQLILETQLFLLDKDSPHSLEDYRYHRKKISTRLTQLHKAEQRPLPAVADERAWPSGGYPYDKSRAETAQRLVEISKTIPGVTVNPDIVIGQQAGVGTIIASDMKAYTEAPPDTEPLPCPCGRDVLQIYVRQMEHIVKCSGCNVQTVSRITPLDAISTWNHHVRAVERRGK